MSKKEYNTLKEIKDDMTKIDFLIIGFCFVVLIVSRFI